MSLGSGAPIHEPLFPYNRDKHIQKLKISSPTWIQWLQTLVSVGIDNLGIQLSTANQSIVTLNLSLTDTQEDVVNINSILATLGDLALLDTVDTDDIDLNAVSVSYRSALTDFELTAPSTPYTAITIVALDVSDTDILLVTGDVGSSCADGEMYLRIGGDDKKSVFGNNSVNSMSSTGAFTGYSGDVNVKMQVQHGSSGTLSMYELVLSVVHLKR